MINAVPPNDPFPTIDQCGPTSSNESCSIVIEEDEEHANITCSVQGASIDLVKLTWSHGGNSNVTTIQYQRSPNTDGTTENIVAMIVVKPSMDSYVCTATVLATRFELVMISVNIDGTVYATTAKLKEVPDNTNQNTTDEVSANALLSSGGKDVCFHIDIRLILLEI